MLDGDFLPIDLVLNEKIHYLKMLSPLGTACPPIGLEQDSTHVVLVEQGWIHVIPLLLHKVASPEVVSWRVVHLNQHGLCRALRVELLLPGITEGHSLTKAHLHPCMPPTVIVHGMRCIQSPQ